MSRGNYNTILSDSSKLILAEQAIKALVKKTNRATSQTKFLYNILNNYEELIELEEALKKLHVGYCPGDLAECYYILAKYRTYKALKWI